MSKTIKLNKTGLYMRLSRDDEKTGESLSIENQRIILQKYVEENGGTIIDEYVDDGWSGTSFNRPGIQRLLDDAKSGKIDTIVVKDLSRFGRNYIQVGQYIDYIFPAYGIRFVALSDNIDTLDRNSSSMDMMPIMNVFNEWHSANTSKKIRAVLEANWKQGKYTNWAYPYGYKAGSDENRTAIIDEVAANVVRRIYDLRIQGKSVNSIARILTDDGIPNPRTYFTRLDGKKINKPCAPFWVPKTVMEILSNPTYIGTLIQHKTSRFSYKNRKILKVPEQERIIKENAHEPIIPYDIWEKVQNINKSVSRGKSDKQKVVHPLSGLLICPDCGKKLKLKSPSKNAKNQFYYFACRTYTDLGKKYCSSHLISERTIEKIVLEDLKYLLGEIEIDEKAAKERFMRVKAKQGEENKIYCEKQLYLCQQRLVELDKLIQSTFEEKVAGKTPEDICLLLFNKYNDEKKILEKQIDDLKLKLAENEQKDLEAEEYINRLKKYGKCEILTREMCLQLINFITVGEIKNDNSPREIHIYYKFIDKHTIEDIKNNSQT